MSEGERVWHLSEKVYQHSGRRDGSPLLGAREAALGMHCGLLTSQYKKGTDMEKHSVPGGPEPMMGEKGEIGVCSVWRRKGQAVFRQLL